MKLLVKNREGRWCVSEKELTCGDSIVVFIKGKGWLNGRIEYHETYGGYFFLCEAENVREPLSEQLEVRTVEEQNTYMVQAVESKKSEEEAQLRFDNFKQALSFVEDSEHWYALFPNTLQKTTELKDLLNRLHWEDDLIDVYQYAVFKERIEKAKAMMLKTIYQWIVARLKDRPLTNEQIVSSVFDVIFQIDVATLREVEGKPYE